MGNPFSSYNFQPKAGVPTAAQVNSFEVDYERAHKISGKPLERLRVGFAVEGDVIYTHKGSVGRVAINTRKCVLTPQTTYYRVNPAYVLNKYLMWYLASQQFSSQVDAVKSQTTRDFVPITQQYLFFHLIPPLEEQRCIVAKVDRLMALCDELEAKLREAEADNERLMSAAVKHVMEAVSEAPARAAVNELVSSVQTR